LTLSEQQYLVLDTASQRTNQQDMQQIAPLVRPLATLYDTQLKFQVPHTCHARDKFSELLNDESLQLEFSKQSSCHFWRRTRNEVSVISDLAIHKLLAFCTTYLCEVAF